MTGEWATKPISIYGRNSISGTYEFFKKLFYAAATIRKT
jgi:phosphate transport system substrate-binding protein